MEVGVKFVIRVPIHNYKSRMDFTLSDQTIRFDKKGKTICLRALKFELDSGVEEVLFTNLMEDSMDIGMFKSLYFRRWGIETKYDELKNKLHIQKFTGDTQELIEQGF
jgi:IS4 transposase